MALNFNARNAMLDFQPVTNALYGYTQGVNDNIKRENWNALAGGGMPGVDPAMSQFIKAAGPDKGPDMYMRAYGNAQDRAYRDRQFTASRTDADRSHELQRQQFGLSAASNARQAQMQNMQIERMRSEARIPVVASILNNPDPASRAEQWRQYIETDSDLVRKMPPPYRTNPELGARWVYGQAGKMVETGQPKVMEVDPGKSLVRVDPSGRAKEVYTNTAPGKMSETTRKELHETDDFVKTSRSAVENLARALNLNKKAYSGTGASTRAAIVNNTLGVISDRSGAIATGEFENVVITQALQSLRSVFGGNPTEGERKIMLDVAGSVNQPLQVRTRILENAYAAAQKRLNDYTNKGDALRSGEFYKPGWKPASGVAPDVRHGSGQSQGDRSPLASGTYNYDPATGAVNPATGSYGASR